MAKPNFTYTSLEELLGHAEALGLRLPHGGDVAMLGDVLTLNGRVIPNRLANHPMEGCDATAEGAPTDFTFRRYARFAAGGAGLTWLEAVAVMPEGRANPRQLMITKDTLPAFKALRAHIADAAAQAGLPAPYTVAQLTHSGRYSKPEPVNAWDGGRVITDGELRSVIRRFGEAAALCREAGFDAVDIKACHLYLYSELLGAHRRPAPFGGALEDRMRALLESADAARQAAGADYTLAARINVYDGEAGAFGSPSFDEPRALIQALRRRGVALFNITMGTPYVNPHVNRPYASGGYEPPEAPIAGVARLLDGCARAKAAAPDALFVATGFSYLRQFAPPIAAGMVAEGGCDIAGFGRQSFAYPDFARDILINGAFNKDKVCLTCGLCTKLMREGKIAGCPVRDREVYFPLLKEAAR